jgi:hypothetical protein
MNNPLRLFLCLSFFALFAVIVFFNAKDAKRNHAKRRKETLTPIPLFSLLITNFFRFITFGSPLVTARLSPAVHRC